MRLLYILNPTAGGTSHDESLALFRNRAEAHGFESRVYTTRGDEDEAAIKRELDLFRPERVVAAGGDGTVGLVARSMMFRESALGILPLGSANGLATALAIPSGEAAFERIFAPQRFKPLDMLLFNHAHYSVHLADIGINALMVKKYHDSEGKGMLAYARHLLSSINESPLLKISVEADDQVHQREGYLMAFANAHRYGTGVQISEGSVSDGRFEICNVQKVALDAAIKAGLTAFNVFIDKDMFSDVISCKYAEIHIDQKTPFQVDGEYLGEVDHLTVELIPAAVRLLM